MQADEILEKIRTSVTSASHIIIVQWPSYLLDGDEDDVAGHDLDDVDLQEPPDEQLQLVKILQELEKEDGQAVDHQVPLVLQV